MKKMIFEKSLCVAILLFSLSATAQESNICKLLVNKKSTQAANLISKLKKENLDKITCFKNMSLLAVATSMSDPKNVDLLISKNAGSVLHATRIAIRSRNTDIVKKLIPHLGFSLPGLHVEGEILHNLKMQLMKLCNIYDRERLARLKKITFIDAILPEALHQIHEKKCMKKIAQNDELWTFFANHKMIKTTYFFSNSIAPAMLDIILKHQAKYFDINKLFHFPTTFISYNKNALLKVLLKHGYTPTKDDLISSIEYGRIELVKLLVERGGLDTKKFRTNKYDYDRPLQIALEYRRDKIFKYLRNKGFRFGSIDEKTRLRYNEEYLQRDLKKAQKLIADNKPLDEAFIRQRFAAKGRLEFIGLFPNSIKFKRELQQKLGDHTIVNYNRSEILEKLISKKIIFDKKVLGKLLNRAAALGFVSMVDVILKSGIKIDSKDRCSVLEEIISSNTNETFLKHLISNGANVNHKGENFFIFNGKNKGNICSSPLSVALEYNSLNALEILLKTKMININNKNDESYLARSIENGKIPLAKLLKTHGATLLPNEKTLEYRVRTGINFTKIYNTL